MRRWWRRRPSCAPPGPGPSPTPLRWEDLQEDRAVVAAESPAVWSLAELRVLGFARTLAAPTRRGRAGTRPTDEVLARELGESYFTHRDRDPALFDDTIPALDALRADYRLGLLSNGSRLPETVGLAGYFESVVFAQDHRVAKPDKGIFEVVERELGVGPEACVLVGDHPVNDVAGAHGAGWRSVWLDRDGTVLFPDDGPRPDAVVASLTGVARRAAPARVDPTAVWGSLRRYTSSTLQVYHRCMGRVRTNIEIEETFLRAIMDRYGVHTKTEAVDLALRHLAGQPMSRDEALAMRGAYAIGEIPADTGPAGAHDPRRHLGLGGIRPWHRQQRGPTTRRAHRRTTAPWPSPSPS